MNDDRQKARRLPDDDAYWDDLVTRSLNAAFGDATASATDIAHDVETWWSPATRSAYALAVAAVLAVLLLLPLTDNGQPASDAEPDGIASALMPDEPLLRTLLSTPIRPTSAGLLVELIALREAERGGNR